MRLMTSMPARMLAQQRQGGGGVGRDVQAERPDALARAMNGERMDIGGGALFGRVSLDGRRSLAAPSARRGGRSRRHQLRLKPAQHLVALHPGDSSATSVPYATTGLDVA
jgi:hypothetical protein